MSSPYTAVNLLIEREGYRVAARFRNASLSVSVATETLVCLIHALNSLLRRRFPRWNAVLRGTLYCIGNPQEDHMLKKSLVVAGTLLFASSAFAQSGATPGASNSAPGQQMHDAKKSTAPGASEYAPGHKMQDAKKSTAPGASEYAPGHQTTGSSGGMKK
jgi:hypothetical protein